jgi:methionyl aminopeptidase
MRNAGKAKTQELADGWTVVAKDRSPAAQREHMAAVTPDGYEVLTVWSDGSGAYVRA